MDRPLHRLILERNEIEEGEDRQYVQEDFELFHQLIFLAQGNIWSFRQI
jgi:hypothetical protein